MAKKKEIIVAIGNRVANDRCEVHAKAYRPKSEFKRIEIVNLDSQKEILDAVAKAVKENGEDCIIGFGKSFSTPAALLKMREMYNTREKKRNEAKQKLIDASKPTKLATGNPDAKPSSDAPSV